MKLEIATRQRKEKTNRPKLKTRTSCPRCESKNIFREGPDQFCCDCDWDTCLEYVDIGLMNNLAVAAWEHFGDSLIKNEEAEKDVKLVASA